MLVHWLRRASWAHSLAWLLVAAVLAFAWLIDSAAPLPSGQANRVVALSLAAAPLTAAALSAIALLVWLANRQSAGVPTPAPREAAPRRTPIVAAYLACAAVTTLSTAESLYFGPKAEAPAYSIDQIYRAVGEDQGTATLAQDIVVPIVFAVLALVASTALLWVSLRFHLATRWACAALLALASGIGFVGFVVGFGTFPMDVPDTLPPGTGGSSIVLLICDLLGQLALCGAILLAVPALHSPTASSAAPSSA